MHEDHDDTSSENGTYPAVDPGDTWVIQTPLFYPTNGGRFGHQMALSHDSLEGHLVTNFISSGTTTSSYPVRGFLTADPGRGWNGPYVDRLPKTDPWGNKYLINMQSSARNTSASFIRLSASRCPVESCSFFRRARTGRLRRLPNNCSKTFKSGETTSRFDFVK